MCEIGGAEDAEIEMDLTRWVEGAVAEELPRPDAAVKASTIRNEKALQAEIVPLRSGELILLPLSYNCPTAHSLRRFVGSDARECRARQKIKG